MSRRFTLVRRHVARHKRKYAAGSIGTAAMLFLALQLIWDIGANDLAAYVQPLFTRVLGPPPVP